MKRTYLFDSNQIPEGDWNMFPSGIEKDIDIAMILNLIA